MATGYLSPIGFLIQLFNNNGMVLAGGKINTYLAGTSTPLATYTDNTLVTANGNPIILDASGRLPASCWVPAGTVIKMVLTDANSNILAVIDNMPSLNDATSLLLPFSNPASGSGADLVANAVRSYSTFADMRAANVPNLATGQTLIVLVDGGNSIGDGLGGAFYWNSTSTAADDDINTIKPTASGSSGRYLRIAWNAAYGLDDALTQYQLGWRDTPQNFIGAGPYTFALKDRGKQVYRNDVGTATFTIPANVAVAFPIGTVIDVINGVGAGVLTLAITTDTLTWFPVGSTGSRTLTAPGNAQFKKISATGWIIVGVGLT